MTEHGRLVVITGPSGVGKSTVVAEVRKRTGAVYSVSATTRRPRAGEADGRDYRFVDRNTFEKMIAGGELLEWAEIYGEYYGTPRGAVNESVASGKTVVMDIDVQGARQVRERAADATFVLILPPDGEELARRLRERGSEDEPAMLRRLHEARKEIAAAADSGLYDHHVVNDELETAVGQVVEIVQQECGRR
ncbi:MAG TPA: guanylate kinase [Phycisphaerae bacterium]|nr:guanylate kinase [Phycisphaerae bacterium]